MTLQEMNDNYDEYILTEEYLQEGLKYFKKSKRLYKFADKIDNKIAKEKMKLEKKGKDVNLDTIEKTSKEIRKLADSYKVVEDAFASKEIDRSTAKQKINDLKIKYGAVLQYIRKENVKKAFKFLGIGALLIGLGAFLTSSGAAPFMANVGNFFNKWFFKTSKTAASTFNRIPQF